MIVEDLLHSSPLRLISAAPANAIKDAARRMAQYNIGLVVVMDDDDRIAGVLSERDIVRGLAGGENGVDDILVADLMTKDVVFVSPTETLVNAVLLMNTHGIRHLLVVQAEKPVGVLSIRDVLRVFSKQILEGKIGSEEDLDPAFINALAAV